MQKKNGFYYLKFKSGGRITTKRVVVSDKIQPLNKIREAPDWLGILYALEKPLSDESGFIESISVSYEGATLLIPIFGFALDWVSFFVVVFIVFILIIKSLVRVY